MPSFLLLSSHLRLVAVREKALGALGKFDDGLSELRTAFVKNPVCLRPTCFPHTTQEKMRSLQAAFVTGIVDSDEDEEGEPVRGPTLPTS